MKVGPAHRGNREHGTEEKRTVVISGCVDVLVQRRFACDERELHLRVGRGCRVGERPGDNGVGAAIAVLTAVDGSLSRLDADSRRVGGRTGPPDGTS